MKQAEISLLHHADQTAQMLTGPKLTVCNQKIFFLFLNQNICCGYSKEPSQ